MDVTTMSPAEVEAEAARRMKCRAEGRTFAERNSAPRSVIREQWLQEIEGSWLAADETFRRVSLPWSVLVPDGEKHQPVIRGTKPFMVLTMRYREAKIQARRLLKQQCLGFAPLAGRVQVMATLFEPNVSRTRDVSNYAKLAHDALSGIVYVDDGQIDDLRWRRGAVCIDRPRLELSITEVSP
mgnify:CR=1 FL=1